MDNDVMLVFLQADASTADDVIMVKLNSDPSFPSSGHIMFHIFAKSWYAFSKCSYLI